jgi:hypothetical protein
LILENSQKIEKLFRLYLNDQCSPEEVKFLRHYFNLGEHEETLKTIIQLELEKPVDADTKAIKTAKEITDRLFKEIKKIKKK